MYARNGTMILLLRLGRYFFAVSMGAFGVQYLIFVHRATDLANIPPYTVARVVPAYLIGAGLMIAAVSIVSGFKAALSVRLLGAALLLDFLVFHAARILANLHSGNIRTRGFETLAMAGAAFVLGATFSAESSGVWSEPIDATANFGRLLVAVSLAIFGIQHFMGTNFIASLIPAWMPARLFLAYFTGTAFVAAALSFATGKLTRLAGILLALMFLIWVAMLHAPLVAHSLHNGNLWASMFVALNMAAIGLIIAEAVSVRVVRG